LGEIMLTILLSSLFGFQEPTMLPIGKYISPEGTHVEIGSYPLNMVLTSDKQFAIVTTSGFRQALSVVSMKTGVISSQFDYKNSSNNPKNDGLYFGLAVHPRTGLIYASRGAQDMVSAYRVTDGKIEEVGTPIVSTLSESRNKLPFHFAGLGFNSSGSRLLVVGNQTSKATNYKGSVTVFDTDKGTPLFEVPVSGFPLACAYQTKGPNADNKAYIGSERDGVVDVVDLGKHVVVRSIATGSAPVGMIFNADQTKLFVANSGSDTVSIIDTKTDKVIDTITVRPSELRGLPGAGPLGISLSDDERQLFVTLGDMQALGVIDLAKHKLVGYSPTGWLPTSVVQQGGHLLIASAKGIQARNPNGKPVGDKGTYIQDIIAGTVSHQIIPNPTSLPKLTKRVMQNNRIRPGLLSNKAAEFRNPGIKHVIYVIKENRTYDNVLGDLPTGHGDPSLTLFPRAVSPNQHALAERFVLFDNFYVCAEVSQDGWQWSISGMASAYGSRNTPYNYSGRGRSYDTEGQNNGEAIELSGITNVAKPAAGYIWELCERSKVSFRNYGMYTQFIDPSDKRNSTFAGAKDSQPNVKVLLNHNDSSYRHYDNMYADSPIYDEYDFAYKNQLKSYGENKSSNRFDEWKHEFDGFVKSGSMPQFQSIRLGNDHTMGTRNGVPTPQSMVADNDYAVGKLVEAVSNSPFWRDTAICVLEDDAQAGIDHIDAHRSTAYVISPYIQRGKIDSRFYNTDSMLRTMELLLGMPPMSQYDAVAPPLSVFGPQATNAEPYTAIKPDRDIVCAVNNRSAYRSKDSERIPRFSEESEIDEELNDILWKSIKGRSVATPKPRFGLFGMRKDKK
jgi:YVTN family beta-propeller protein